MTNWNELPTNKLRDMMTYDFIEPAFKAKVAREILDREQSLDDLHDAMIDKLASIVVIT